MDTKRKVMVIDDDRDLAFLVQDLLTDSGYEVLLAYDMEDAYNKLADQKVDVILLDINLPDGLGFELCEGLRKISNVPVIFASARTSEDDKVRGLDIGGDDYIEKPFSLKELLSRINSLVRRSYGNCKNNPIMEYGISETITLTVDSLRRTVMRNGRLISLSPREYELLLYFIQHEGIALSKEQLIHEVWGMYSEVEPATHAVHVRWLREKLEEEPSNPSFLKTVWGKGYLCELWKEK